MLKKRFENIEISKTANLYVSPFSEFRHLESIAALLPQFVLDNPRYLTTIILIVRVLVLQTIVASSSNSR